MIVLLVKYTCKEGLRDAFLEEINRRRIGEKCRTESGNFMYEYSCIEGKNNEIRLIEIWESEEALYNHGRQAHFKEIGNLKAQFVENTEIEKIGD